MRAASCALALVALAACGGTRPAGADEPAAQGVSAYLNALKADDPKSAYAMLSKQTRKEVSFAAFEAEWKEHAAERGQQAHTLEEGLHGDRDLGEEARAAYGDGKSVTLKREAGHWRLDSGLVSHTHAGSPHVAIEIFAEALAGHSYDDVMRILTQRRREGIAQQVDAFAHSLQKNLGDTKHKVSFVGKDRAELAWDEGDIHYKIVLRMEGDEWRVDDVHVQPGTPETK